MKAAVEMTLKASSLSMPQCPKDLRANEGCGTHSERVPHHIGRATPSGSILAQTDIRWCCAHPVIER